MRVWRKKKALEATLNKRPDLLDITSLSEEDQTLIKEIRKGKSESPEKQE